MNKDNPTKTCITLEVKGKVFEINFVSNWVLSQWEHHAEEIEKAQALGEQYQILLRDFTEKKVSPEDFQKLIREIKTKLKDISTATLYRSRIEIVKEILESNEHPFDKAWWDRKTDPADVIAFIAQCINKDLKKN